MCVCLYRRAPFLRRPPGHLCSIAVFFIQAQCLYHCIASASFDCWQPAVSYGWNKYIVSIKQKQSTFTGKQQRHAVNAFPLVVPGLLASLSGNPPPGEATPAAPLDGVDELPVQAVGAAASSTVPVWELPPVNDNQAQDGENTECSKERGYDGDQIETYDDTPAVMPGYKYDWVAYRAASGNSPFPQAVTAMFAKYAVLYARISGQVGESLPPPMKLAVGSEIAQQATAWVNDYVSPILGTIRAQPTMSHSANIASTCLTWHNVTVLCRKRHVQQCSYAETST